FRKHGLQKWIHLCRGSSKENKADYRRSTNYVRSVATQLRHVCELVLNHLFWYGYFVRLLPVCTNNKFLIQVPNSFRLPFLSDMPRIPFAILVFIVNYP